MEHYEQLTFADLMRGEKLKYLRGDVYELRIPIKKVNYRFLGYPDRTTLYMVHALVKKTLGRTV